MACHLPQSAVQWEFPTIYGMSLTTVSCTVGVPYHIWHVTYHRQLYSGSSLPYMESYHSQLYSGSLTTVSCTVGVTHHIWSLTTVSCTVGVLPQSAVQWESYHSQLYSGSSLPYMACHLPQSAVQWEFPTIYGMSLTTVSCTVGVPYHMACHLPQSAVQWEFPTIWHVTYHSQLYSGSSLPYGMSLTTVSCTVGVPYHIWHVTYHSQLYNGSSLPYMACHLPESAVQWESPTIYGMSLATVSCTVGVPYHIWHVTCHSQLYSGSSLPYMACHLPQSVVQWEFPTIYGMSLTTVSCTVGVPHHIWHVTYQSQLYSGSSLPYMACHLPQSVVQWEFPTIYGMSLTTVSCTVGVPYHIWHVTYQSVVQWEFPTIYGMSLTTVSCTVGVPYHIWHVTYHSQLYSGSSLPYGMSLTTVSCTVGVPYHIWHVTYHSQLYSGSSLPYMACHLPQSAVQWESPTIYGMSLTTVSCTVGVPYHIWHVTYHSQLYSGSPLPYMACHLPQSAVQWEFPTIYGMSLTTVSCTVGVPYHIWHVTYQSQLYSGSSLPYGMSLNKATV